MAQTTLDNFQQTHQQREPLLHSSTAAGRQLLSIAKRHRDTALLTAARHQLAGVRHADLKNPNSLIGAIEAALLQGAGATDRTEAELSLAQAGRAQIDQVLSAVKQLLNDYSGQLSKAESDLTVANDSFEKSQESNQAAFKEAQDDRQVRMEEFLGAAKKRIGDIENRYEQQLILEKPAKHWSDLEDNYDTRARWWFFFASTLSVALLSLLLRVLYLPPESLEFHSFAGAMGVRGLILLGLIISVSVYMIRLLFKLSISAFHLSRDARERSNLTYFYLSLLNTSDQAITPEQRQIVFQALFSRADTGLLRSDGPSMPSGNIDAIIGSFKDSHGK